MYALKRVRPHIWHIEMDCRYELAMTFLRASEVYESLNPDFRDKFGWTLHDQMKWYSTADDSPRNSPYGTFSFANDWGGYNVPSDTLDALYCSDPNFRNNNVVDWNDYDERMYGFLSEIRKEEKGQYYLIGTRTGIKDGTFGHEVAHGYFFTCEGYRSAMLTTIRKDANWRAVNLLKSAIKDLGYCDEVLEDEVQAYCSTGFPEAFAYLIKNHDVQALVREVGQIFAAQEKKHG